MESIAFLVSDILERLKKIPGLQIDQITAGGGAARRPLLQFQADLVGLPIRHSAIPDATALGCAFLAGLQIKFWKDVQEIQKLIHSEGLYAPNLAPAERQLFIDRWHELLKATGILS